MTRRSSQWRLLCCTLGVASVLVWFAQIVIGLSRSNSTWVTDHLVWNPALWHVQPWTLWTASLVHLNAIHLLANLLALGALAVLGVSLHAGRAATLALLVAWPLGTLSLVWWPQVTWYGGLSGVIHACAAVLWSWAAMHGTAKPVSFVLFAGLGLKLLGEHAWSQPVAFSLDWGFNVVYAAHLGGALAGAAAGCIVAAATRFGSFAPTRSSSSH